MINKMKSRDMRVDSKLNFNKGKGSKTKKEVKEVIDNKISSILVRLEQVLLTLVREIVEVDSKDPINSTCSKLPSLHR